SKVKADYVKPYMLVPIKKLSLSDERIGVLKQIGGVVINERDGRVYPLGEAAAHLTGYVQSVSKEDLEKDEEGIYTINSVIGKTGLESIYESRIRGIDGTKIYIVNEKNEEVKVVSERLVKNGENIKLTIDSTLQEKGFNGLKGEKGSNVTMDPKTGEVLTLVSSPSYDPNDFVLGVSNEKWEEFNNNESKPLLNRFQGNVSPGSAFKPITAAIGLETKKLDPNEDKKITDLKWQKDNSWGGYSITRVKEYEGSSNLNNAMAYSDNIYFAKTALDIGAKDFHDMLAKLGMGEALPFDFPMNKSKISSVEGLSKEILLGDSGYGQGEILMNPLHLGVLYTMFSNDGDVLTPIIEFGKERTVWKSGIISKENSNIVKESIRGVVTIPNATGNGLNIQGKTVLGKTGTAEIKTSQSDENGTEIGWTVGMTDGQANSRLVVTFIEDVKGRGGSGYVIPKVREMLE
ncbi:MAG: penicillin-binding transpeptidase domain-containing protein, partial [Clostridium sp.]